MAAPLTSSVVVTLYYCAKLMSSGCEPGSVDFVSPVTEDCEQALIFIAKQAEEWQKNNPDKHLEGGASCQWVGK